MADFPVVLTNAVDLTTEIVAKHLNNLEAKVGIDGSAVVTSLDYLLKNPASIDPGHKHSKLWAADGDPETVTVNVDGKVGIGTAGTLYLGLQVHSNSAAGVFGAFNVAATKGITLNPNNVAGIVDIYSDYISGASEPKLHLSTYTYRSTANGITIDTSGKVGINTNSPTVSGTGKLHLAGDTLRLDTARTPASAGAAGNAGEICWDANYIYLCIATNTWRRIAHVTWP